MSEIIPPDVNALLLQLSSFFNDVVKPRKDEALATLSANTEERARKAEKPASKEETK